MLIREVRWVKHVHKLGHLDSGRYRSLHNSPPRARRGRSFGIGLAFFVSIWPQIAKVRKRIPANPAKSRFPSGRHSGF